MRSNPNNTKFFFFFVTFFVYGIHLASNKTYAQNNTITPWVSQSQDRKEGNPLYNRNISGKVFISIKTSAKNIDRVIFWLDDSFGKGKPLNVDKWPPFDLLDQRRKHHNKRPKAFDTRQRKNGAHSILFKFVFTDGSSAKMLTPFTIFNDTNIPFSQRYKKQQ